MSFLANLFRGSTISREVPTVNYPEPGEVTPSLFPSGGPGTSIVTTEPAQPEVTTRTISTRRPPPLLAFIADFLAGLSRQGAGPGIQARLQSQQDDLNRQMKEIDREPQLKEAEYEKSKPQWKVNSDGSVVMVRPGLLETQGARAVTVFGKKESDPIKFEETLAKVQKDYGVEFTPRDRARAYLKYQAYLGQEKENRNPSQFFGELEQIVSEGQKRETEQGLFDNNFDDAKSALLSLGPFDKEEQAQVGAAIANSQLKKTVQPLQLLATSIAGKRQAVEIKRMGASIIEPSQDEIEAYAEDLESGQIETTNVPVKLRGKVLALIKSRGGVVVSKDKREQINAFQSAQQIVNDIEEISKKVNTETGFRSVIVGRTRQAAALAQEDPDVSLFQSKRGTLGLLIRALGERGVLTEGDIQRAGALIPLVTDSKTVAERKINALRGLMTNIEKTRLGAAGQKLSLPKSQAGPKYAIGDVVIYQGKRHRVTAVNTDGTYVLALDE